MAAGNGFKSWSTGDVLTANDVNNYLMQGVWVFDDSSDRTTQVTAPAEGNFSFLKDTNALEYYDGSAWVAVGGGAASFAGASVTAAGNQSATQYVLTAITWDSENFDTDAFHDNATNNSRITIPAGKGGYYQVNARAGCGPNGGRWEVYIYKNGSQYQATRLLNSEQPAPQISVVMSLTAGDYIEVYGYPESSTPTIYKGKYGDFSVAYLGA